MTGPTDLDDECRDNAVAALGEGDWHSAYAWAKSWINRGGAGLLDPWLVYVASALVHGQPRSAVHSVDLALRGWFSEPVDRAVLLYLRSLVVWLRLGDPKTARADLEAASFDAPAWLRPDIESRLETIEADASRSRKRKASVLPAPRYEGASEGISHLDDRRLEPETRPDLWDMTVIATGDREDI